MLDVAGKKRSPQVRQHLLRRQQELLHQPVIAEAHLAGGRITVVAPG
jgi:hypothetical protein